MQLFKHERKHTSVHRHTFILLFSDVHTHSVHRHTFVLLFSDIHTHTCTAVYTNTLDHYTPGSFPLAP